MATVADLLSRAVTEIRRRLNGNGALETVLRDRLSSRRAHAPIPKLDKNVERAIGNVQLNLVERQRPEHYWVGELIGDTTLESDYVTMMYFLDIVDTEKQRKLLNYVLSQQNEDGGWPIFNGGPSELNATIKAYFALRMAGHSEYEPRLRRAHEAILNMGGIEATNSYTKFYLAMFGQYEWEKLPAMIPEIILFPSWFWFNIYEVSAWTRTIVVPMMIIYALRPSYDIDFSVRDLNVPFKHPKPDTAGKAFWQRYFKTADRLLHWYNRLPIKPLRRWAMHKAVNWMLERNKPPGGLGAIFPPMLNTMIALKALGYSKDSPEFQKALREFQELEVRDGDVIRMQPCHSSVWDTSWVVHSLARTGLKDHASVQKGAEWLQSKQVFSGGDWQIKNPGVEPAAWFFENDNAIYPDTDDTVAVLMALHFAGRDKDENFAKGVKWLLSMRNKDGGWGAFDRDNNKDLLNCVPWSDHNALLDPSTPDITGRILELLGYLGFTKEDRIVEKAIQYLRKNQEADGSWYGRWGVNYLYGTWQVLVGLNSVKQNMNRGWVKRAVEWLKSVQNPDGGWGESCRSYEDLKYKAVGPSTASQTAWGLLGLVAGRCSTKDPSVQRAVKYLIDTQNEAGGWDETEHTGTGFPRVFYLVYTMYRDYFPLLALHAYREALASETKS
jgi:squalene-hopene/tetraprenyl-beta-curcumene cyclase